MHAHTHACTHVHTHSHKNTHSHTHTETHTHTQTHTHTNTHMHAQHRWMNFPCIVPWLRRHARKALDATFGQEKLLGGQRGMGDRLGVVPGI